MLPVLPEGVKNIVPAPPVLEKVCLTVGASIKVVQNKQKAEQWKNKVLKAATLMYHMEQQKKAVDGENCVNRMSADEVEAAINKRFSGTAGPSASSIHIGIQVGWCVAGSKRKPGEYSTGGI